MRAIGRDEVQLYSPPRLSEPFPHDLRVMIACVVEKDMDEDQHRIERLDRFQKPDRRGGVDGFDLDHSGLTGLEIDRAMDDCSATIWMGTQRQSGWSFRRSRREDDCRGPTITQAIFA